MYTHIYINIRTHIYRYTYITHHALYIQRLKTACRGKCPLHKVINPCRSKNHPCRNSCRKYRSNPCAATKATLSPCPHAVKAVQSSLCHTAAETCTTLHVGLNSQTQGQNNACSS